MPAKSPRINVTLPPEHMAVIAALARYNQTSQSKLIAELVDAAIPVLEKMVTALEAVKQMDAEKRSAIVATLSDAQRDAEHTAATALALLERISAPRVPQPEGDAQRPAPAATRDRQPARSKPVARRRSSNLPPSS
jgi:hypothetical protein